MNCKKHGADESSSKEKSKPRCPEASMVLEKPGLGITIYDKKWTDGSVSLQSVSKDIEMLGKVSLRMRIVRYSDLY